MGSNFNPPRTWCGPTVDDIQNFTIDYRLLASDIISAHTGPDCGVQVIDQLTESSDKDNNRASSIPWSGKNRKAFGVTLSLYDQNPVTGKYSGDPVADCFAFVSRKNNAILGVADGVNWGEKPRLAARCALYGAMNFLHDKIFIQHSSLQTTQEALKLMRTAFDVAHDTIIKHAGGLTTLNITMVLPMKDCSQYAVCSVNVGDSLAFVFSKRYGISELSIGSHDINEERNIRDAGGALGPVDGTNPLLVNLTFSLSTCEPGDLIFLTTDGISDNFDPVVTKIAVPGQKDTVLCSVDHKAEMLPHERHLFSMKGMERVIHEYELETEYDISAEELCTALVEHVIKLTQPKRDVIEDPQLYNKKYKSKERRRIEEGIKSKLKAVPGKLDHATVVAYEAGIYRGEVGVNTGYNNNNCNNINCNNNSNSGSKSNCNNNSNSGSNRSSLSSSTLESSPSTVFESNV